jgi:uncharacterized glyoxalase superfamily metalloenzyme YdcJ
MVEVSKENLSNFETNYNPEIFIEKLNAKFVNEFRYFDEIKNSIIVTEGYL